MHPDYVYLDRDAAEHASMVKVLCETYSIVQNDLCFFKNITEIASAISEDATEVRKVKTIPIRLPIPEILTPKDGDNHISIALKPTPDFDRYLGPGLHEYSLSMLNYQGDNKIRFWFWVGMGEYYPLGTYLIIVERKNLKAFYRCLLTLQNKTDTKVITPILPAKILKSIYENSIGFLTRAKEKRCKYREFNIPYKRGILLCGPPGTGKTLSCKWLKQLCIENDLSHRIVTIEEYRRHQQHGNARALFRLPESKPGLLFFDDMDIFVKDRQTQETEELRLFLTHLDGIIPANGAVFVFTTNYAKQLDSAFVRPGRIDLCLTFKSPSKSLRKKFIQTLFHKELLDQIDCDNIVRLSDTYTYAELEEVRKLMILDIIDGKKVDAEATFKTFEIHRQEFKEQAQLGLHAIGNEETDEYDPFDDAIWIPPQRRR